MDQFNLEGKVAIVTGGNGGIGLAYGRGLVKAGAKVVIWGRNEEKNKNAAEELKRLGGDAIAFVVDVTDSSQVANAFESSVTHFGQIDICFANAGNSGPWKSLHKLSESSWNKVMDINLTSMMYVTKAAAPYLAKNENSSIVNLASLAGRKGGHPGSLAYATSKGAILTYTRALSTELGPQGIRVNAVAPGLILGTSFHNTHTTKESAAATTAGIPIQRAGNAADVARAVLYLASEYDGFITGATLDINGGVYNM